MDGAQLLHLSAPLGVVAMSDDDGRAGVTTKQARALCGSADGHLLDAFHSVAKLGATDELLPRETRAWAAKYAAGSRDQLKASITTPAGFGHLRAAAAAHLDHQMRGETGQGDNAGFHHFKQSARGQGLWTGGGMSVAAEEAEDRRVDAIAARQKEYQSAAYDLNNIKFRMDLHSRTNIAYNVPDVPIPSQVAALAAAQARYDAALKVLNDNNETV